MRATYQILFALTAASVALGASHLKRAEDELDFTIEWPECVQVERKNEDPIHGQAEVKYGFAKQTEALEVNIYPTLTDKDGDCFTNTPTSLKKCYYSSTGAVEPDQTATFFRSLDDEKHFTKYDYQGVHVTCEAAEKRSAIPTATAK